MFDKINFNAKFDGQDADSHQVRAYDSISALYGITRGILIPTHYIVEGKVRHRNIQSENYNLFIKPPKQGSVDFPFELIVVSASVLANHPVVTGVATNIISEFITNSMKRAVGKIDKINPNSIDDNIDEGAKDAIAAAMEPALRAGHKIINNGVVNLTINSGGGNVIFDHSTKNYLNNFDISPFPKTRLMSVSSYNANSNTGGAFDSEEGRVIPFFLSKNPDAATLRTISDSQSAYIEFKISEDNADRERAFIAFQHYEIRDVNQKLKRIKVIKARPNFEAL